MRFPNKATVAVTAGLAFSAMPMQAVAEEPQSVGGPEAAALSVQAQNVQAQQVMTRLGDRVLRLRQAAPHNRHVEAVATHSAGSGVQEVEIGYTANRPSHRAGLGNYIVTAAFATTKSKKLNAHNVIDVSVSQDAGKGGPYALLDLKKTKNSGYQFTGNYQNKRQKYTGNIQAATQPASGEQKLTGNNLTAAAKQMTALIVTAPTGRAITKQFKPPFSKILSLPPLTGDPTPLSPVELPPATPTPQLPTPPEDPFAPNNIGVDISNFNCTAQLPPDAKYAFINGNDGIVFSTNPCLDQQVNLFRGKFGLYFNISFNQASTHLDPSVCAPADTPEQCLEKEATKYGQDAAQYDIQAMEAHGIDVRDVEIAEDMESRADATWSDNPQLNRNSITGMHDALVAYGVSEDKFMMYTTTENWQDLTDEQTDTGVEHYQTGWNEWGATFETTPEAAKTYCSIEPFTGTNTSTGKKGKIKMIQYLPGGIDRDIRC